MTPREIQRNSMLALAHRLAPELSGRPLYLVEAPELGLAATDRGVSGVIGCAQDIACRDAIGSRWRGRGWCIVLRQFQDSEGTLLHELAHILDGTMPWRELCTVSEDVVATTLRQDLQRHFTEYERPASDPWHGADFHRALIHLCDRARRVGLWVSWREVGPLAPCPMHILAEALREELDRCRLESFSSITTRPMPRRFRSLWFRSRPQKPAERLCA